VIERPPYGRSDAEGQLSDWLAGRLIGQILDELTVMELELAMVELYQVTATTSSTSRQPLTLDKVLWHPLRTLGFFASGGGDDEGEDDDMESYVQASIESECGWGM
jgi:hypothetical protein